MTVEELIDCLKDLPQKAFVIIDRDSSGFLDPSGVKVTNWDEVTLVGRFQVDRIK